MYCTDLIATTSLYVPYVPPLWSIIPFAALLVLIAALPMIPRAKRFWHSNRNKLLVSLAICVPVMLFYLLAHPKGAFPHGAEEVYVPAGWDMLRHVLRGAMIDEYLPFITLLLSLYVISGGVRLRGDLPAHPRTNTAFLAVGAVLASFIGTTGAAMLLIRPLLQTNSERKHVRHTVIFFIFIVCNIGGCLLPIGDPPLLLGYLQGVPFAWTLHLAAQWAMCNALLLAVYYVWDSLAYARETFVDRTREDVEVEPLGLRGKINFLYLLGVVLALAFLAPGKALPFLPGVLVPDLYLREVVLLAMTWLSLATTPRGLRKANEFSLSPMAEVAAIFVGIFITMQAPLEILHARGPSLGLTQPWQFFWATGLLSSFLDNAPTYMVFFQTANSLTPQGGEGILALANGQFIRADLLAAISLGAVFMGANTYIGNGPNFMVKAIAERHGVKMPTFLHYMAYSACVLIPIFVLMTLVMFVLRWV